MWKVLLRNHESEESSARDISWKLDIPKGKRKRPLTCGKFFWEIMKVRNHLPGIFLENLTFRKENVKDPWHVESSFEKSWKWGIIRIPLEQGNDNSSRMSNWKDFLEVHSKYACNMFFSREEVLSKTEDRKCKYALPFARTSVGCLRRAGLAGNKICRWELAACVWSFSCVKYREVII